MKKKILFLLFMVVGIYFINAQVPEKFNYQGILRNASGELITNTKVAIQISLLEGSSTAIASYTESHTVTTNAYGQFAITIGDGTNQSGSVSSIDWSSGMIFLKTGVDENGETSFKELGTVQLITVPYAMHSNSAENLGNKNIYAAGSDTLFVVKDYDGNVVFAVFPDGAAVYVNEQAKGKVGGFAVSGRSPSKAIETDIFRVTPDSTRIFVRDTVNTKGKVGGFAVSGRSPSKGNGNDILLVTADSTRVYVNEPITKGKVGGFAVSGRSPSKSTISNYMSLTKENYFIGHEAGKSNTTGLYNSFMGYNAGINNTEGSRNTILGYKSGYSNINGYGNIMIGDSSGFSNTEGKVNVFIGSNSGKENLDGHSNTFLGYASGTNNKTGIRNTYVGTYSGHFHETGDNNTALGSSAGSELRSGSLNTFVGAFSALWTMEGTGNTFLGAQTGGLADTVRNCIFIGTNAGVGCRNAVNNIFIGNSAGQSSSDNASIFIGYGSGRQSEGRYNVFIGSETGGSNTTGTSNVYLGYFSGYNNSTGLRNLFLGNRSGYSNVAGDSSIFIGSNAGYHELESSKLYIENSAADKTAALIYGEFDNDILGFNASVGIGTVTPVERLEVKDGNIRVTNGSIIDDGTVLSDFVFEPGYQLESIEEHAQFMWKNKHLPALLSKKEIKDAGGYDIVERREQMLEELEKAHIYIEQLNSELKNIKSEHKQQIVDLKSENAELKQKLNEIIELLSKE